jgi:hypothetical protein
MKQLFFGLLLGPLLLASPPLQVVAVVRAGMPPFEEDGRLYRLEGEGCQALRVSELLTLRRSGERRPLGRLEVTAVKDGFALARLALAGETYPLKGDLAVRHEMIRALPSLPGAAKDLTIPPEALAPRVPARGVPPALSRAGARRESIFFLKGNAELSPGAIAKLRGWVEGWDPDGRWVVLVPENASQALVQARVEALRAGFKALGVNQVEMRALPPEVPGKYDLVYISKEPW